MEEYVGKIWHKTITKFSDHRFVNATVFLNDLSDRLALQFHALGGQPNTQIVPTQLTLWSAKPSLLSRFANVGDKTQLAWKDRDSIRLPSEIAVFPTEELNSKLYLWLVVILSIAKKPTDNWLYDSQQNVLRATNKYPGIKKIYDELVDIHLKYRTDKAYVRKEYGEDELLIRQALRNPGSEAKNLSDPLMLPPVPLWLHPVLVPTQSKRSVKQVPDKKERTKTDLKKLKEKHRRRGEVVEDQDGRSGLISFRLESYFSWSEFFNLDRSADDSDEDSAQRAADDMDVISISDSSNSLSSRVKFDLDLPASDFDDEILSDGILLPEWNFKTQQLVEDYCSLKVMQPKGTQPCDIPLNLVSKVKILKAQFESLKPEKCWIKNQHDGSELDLDNIIRFRTDVARGEMGNFQGLFKALRHDISDLSCLLLADLSLSTDAWINNDARVIDVIRESLYLFSEALTASGDSYAISGFSSVKRNNVRYYQIKNFEQQLNNEIRGHIKAIEPGYYTRMGAAIRQATSQLLNQKTAQKLLLILTDGKPNDLDRYEGRYGIEDTRRSIQEARQKGLQTFCITIDEDANQYLPYLFGKNNYVLVRNAQQLPNKLLKLYSQLTS